MNVICTTTINPPTEALMKFAARKDWHLVIAGDLKTPHELYQERKEWTYLHPHDQVDMDLKLSEAIGWNCIQRRNFAFLYATQEMKASIVATVDDDNIPYDWWGENVVVGRNMECVSCECRSGVFDPLEATNNCHLWHRGFPLSMVGSKEVTFKKEVISVPDVQADLWNGNADLDAVCRLMHNDPDVRFLNTIFFQAKHKLSPFNSQNTFLLAGVMPNYFMFPHIGRWDDIVASYYVGAKGARVVYGPASVYQKRNPHNIADDFKNELWGHNNMSALLNPQPEDVAGAILRILPQQSVEAFRLYQKHYE